MTPNAAHHPVREPVARRASFRRAREESGLSEQQLETLEQKRRQLDDSIHRYIAAKEREYKQLENDLKSQQRAQASEDVSNRGARAQGVADREGPAEATNNATNHVSATPSSTRHPQVQPTDRTTNMPPSAQSLVPPDGRTPRPHREEDFVGVFTPPFLSALASKAIAISGSSERTSSDPSVPAQSPNREMHPPASPITRALSDTIIHAPQASPKRPAHLHLSNRTSSSGSSVDGRLISAMKSPKEQIRVKQKRVSLAVGNDIVAPSDNVPVSLSNSATPSHSKARATVGGRSVLGASGDTAAVAASSDLPKMVVASPEQAPSLLASSLSLSEAQAPQQSRSPQNAQPNGVKDDMGEFWHLEEPDSHSQEENLDLDLDLPPSDHEVLNEEPTNNFPAGRYAIPSPSSRQSNLEPLPTTSTDLSAKPDPFDTSSPFSLPSSLPPSTPLSAAAPLSPGFRRPGVVQDPLYTGKNYPGAAKEAEERGVYGSSYIGYGSSKGAGGSFGGRSLGESYMERFMQDRRMGERVGARS
ncbi:hypothetical protein B0A48_01947 [Cryoendolithus antarcticus]|uniref:Uncharacterized protein n=1 Tax=Cryoendolithus antarcticus TaxID=1507870 RepID=A0A1V8TQR2_9PEZI|nr:hypothetical protein B0A48_01947 [Cryoendolithus antarcticus]